MLAAPRWLSTFLTTLLLVAAVLNIVAGHVLLGAGLLVIVAVNVAIDHVITGIEDEQRENR